MYKVKLVEHDYPDKIFPDTGISGESDEIHHYQEEIFRYFGRYFGTCYEIFQSDDFDNCYVVGIKEGCRENIKSKNSDFIAFLYKLEKYK